jgi:ABC-type branched-subunit amino acid transport system substrate-binding protein
LIVHGQDAAEEIGRDAIRAAAGSTGAQIVGEASFPVSQQGVIDAIPAITAQARSSGANALFLTSGTAGALPFLAQLLPESGLTPDAYQFIGLQRWDIPASALSVPGLRNGWFALPDPGLTAAFQSRYAAAYGGAPHPIAGLAYDGIAAIGALAQSGRADALGTSGLTQGQGFAGVNGIFRFRSDGTNQRGLAVAQIQNGQVVVIDPAPRAFGGAGS